MGAGVYKAAGKGTAYVPPVGTQTYHRGIKKKGPIWLRKQMGPSTNPDRDVSVTES